MENPDFLYPAPGSRERPTGVCSALVLALCALLAAVGCAAPYGVRLSQTVPAAVDAPATETNVTTGVEHVVQRGQTLWRIARAYGLDPDGLARVNGIDDPTRIETGQVLFIPGAVATLDVPPYVEPTEPDGVRADDSLRDVAPEGPWLWPVSRPRVLSGFGAPRRSRTHQGLDLRGAPGDPIVVASRSGLVVYSGAGMNGYGKTVILDHGDGISSLYAHNSRLLVHGGESVERGQAIARVGQSGNASAVHCHFEIRDHGRPVDPLIYLEPIREARR